MTVTQITDGVVHDRGGVRWLDTNAMEWEPMPGLPGYHQKVLARDEDGEPSVTLNHIPSGLLQKGLPAALPYRHIHRTVREFAFVLQGESVGWEYESPDQLQGDLVRKKAGYFMDRRPGSIHGVEAAAPFSVTGAILLNWRETGPGVWFGERDFDTETVSVPYEQSAPFTPGEDAPHEAGAACVRNRGGVTWIDTRQMEWEPMPAPLPEVEGFFFHKVLVRDEAGEVLVRVNYVPPAEILRKLPFRAAGVNVHQRAFMLEGKLASWEYESADKAGDGDLVTKVPGYFQDRQPGSLHGTQPPGATTVTGAVWMNWLGPSA